MSNMFAVIVGGPPSYKAGGQWPEGQLMIRQNYLATAAAAADLLAHPAVAQSWDKPSALAGYAVSGLAGHLAG